MSCTSGWTRNLGVPLTLCQGLLGGTFKGFRGLGFRV